MKSIIKITTLLMIFIVLFSIITKTYAIDMNLNSDETENYTSENIASTTQSNASVASRSNSDAENFLSIENILSIIIIVIGIILIFLGIAIIIRCK